MSFENKLKEVNSRLLSVDEKSFNGFIELFVNDSLKEERFEYYSNIKNINKFDNLAEAKHFLIKSIFSNYIQDKLLLANSLSNSRIQTEIDYAVEIVKEIDKIRKVFKSHDVVDYKKFMMDSEPNITDLELNFLFGNPSLNEKEIENLTEAFIKALGKKHKVSSESDFQRKFFSHPLMGCLEAYSDIKKFKEHIENNVIELGHYKNLVSIVLHAREQLNAEAYQGFITFLIKEDITKGFSNIIKLKDYEPKYLKKILSSIAVGEKLKNEEVEKLIEEIKENHTKNLRIEKDGIKHVNTSNHSLNDYGFPIKENGLNIFFHGHATENHGEKQAHQQANTSLNLDFEKIYEDNIGLTVTKHSVLKNDHHKTFLKKSELDEHLNVSRTEEILFSNLLIDSGSFSRLATLVEKSVREGKNIREELTGSKIFSTNHLIVKSDIERSQKIILSKIGKSDFELLCEHKNAYMNLFAKNKDFMTKVLEQGTTNNYLSFELLAKPTMDAILNLLDIESESNFKLFNKEEIKLITEFANVTHRNNEISEKARMIRGQIKRRDEGSLEDINVEKYQYLSALAENDKKKIEAEKTENEIKTHSKFINAKNHSLMDSVDYLDQNPIDDSYSEKYKKEVNLALTKKILQEVEKINYRSDKMKRLKEGVKDTCYHLMEGTELIVGKTDWNTDKYGIPTRTMSELLRSDGKNEDVLQKESEILLGILKIAEISKSKLTSLRNGDLSQQIKMKR